MPRAWITRATVHHNTRDRYNDSGFAGFAPSSPYYRIELEMVTDDPEFVERLWEYFHGEGVGGQYGTPRRALPPQQHEIAPTPTAPALPAKIEPARELRAARVEDDIPDAEFWNEGDDPE